MSFLHTGLWCFKLLSYNISNKRCVFFETAQATPYHTFHYTSIFIFHPSLRIEIDCVFLLKLYCLYVCACKSVCICLGLFSLLVITSSSAKQETHQCTSSKNGSGLKKYLDNDLYHKKLSKQLLSDNTSTGCYLVIHALTYKEEHILGTFKFLEMTGLLTYQICSTKTRYVQWAAFSIPLLCTLIFLMAN